jgi:hypothetical protein
LALPAVQPSGQRHQHHLQRDGVDHEPDLIAWLARPTPADSWNTTPTIADKATRTRFCVFAIAGFSASRQRRPRIVRASIA